MKKELYQAKEDRELAENEYVIYTNVIYLDGKIGGTTELA